MASINEWVPILMEAYEEEKKQFLIKDYLTSLGIYDQVASLYKNRKVSQENRQKLQEIFSKLSLEELKHIRRILNGKVQER